MLSNIREEELTYHLKRLSSYKIKYLAVVLNSYGGSMHTAVQIATRLKKFADESE